MKRLLLSIHDVSPRFEAEVDRLHAILSRHARADRIALLVVPNHWGDAPLRPGTAFATKLRSLAEQGAEIFLHGYLHQDDCRHSGRASRLKAKHMTAGEGEFLGLDRSTALRRMQSGQRLLEDVCGGPVAGFIAPAWLYGPGAMAALVGDELRRRGNAFPRVATFHREDPGARPGPHLGQSQPIADPVFAGRGACPAPGDALPSNRAHRRASGRRQGAGDPEQHRARHRGSHWVASASALRRSHWSLTHASSDFPAQRRTGRRRAHCVAARARVARRRRGRDLVHGSE